MIFKDSIKKSSRIARRFGPRGLGVLFLSLTLGAGVVMAETRAAEDSESEEAPSTNPMETEGLDPKLSRILFYYYQRTFTGPEEWEEVQSVIYEGVLRYPEVDLHFTAYKKKPDFSKVVLRNPKSRGRYVMAYDGEETWQSNTLRSEDASPAPMSEGEARNFIREAPIGGHLLNPLMEGKQIEVGDVVEVDGHTCYELEVTLPNGERIRSAIDIVKYAERRQVSTNHVNNKKEIQTYSDFRVVEGVRFPFASTLTSDGEQLHRVEISNIRVNPGLPEAIFARPSAVDAPAPEENAIEDSQQKPPSTDRFGELPFGESAFPDAEEIETP